MKGEASHQWGKTFTTSFLSEESLQKKRKKKRMEKSSAKVPWKKTKQHPLMMGQKLC